MNVPSLGSPVLSRQLRRASIISALTFVLMACGGGGGGGSSPQPAATPNTPPTPASPNTPSTPVPAPTPGNTPVGPSIVDDRDTVFAVQSGNVEFIVDKQTFDLQASRDGAALLTALGASVGFNGQNLNIGNPQFNSSGSNWVQQQGWFDEASNLWYVAHFRFWDDAPFVHLAFSITDRHENSVTEAHWDNLWQQRVIQDFQLSIESALPVPSRSLTQENAFSGGNVNTDPRIQEVAANDQVQWRQSSVDDNSVQLAHEHDNSRQTFITIHPRKTGNFSLSLHQQPLLTPYPAANAVEVEVHHTGGMTVRTVDQGNSSNALGSFTLNQESFLKIVATGVTGDRVVFGRLELADGAGNTEVVQANRLEDNLLNAEPIGMAVKDFWKKFPINVSSGGSTLELNAIQEPIRLVGGVGFTFDVGINVNPAANPNSELVARLQAAPEVSYPEWWPDLDGRIVDNASYRRLQAMTPQVIRQNDEINGNYGLMNWGDYQIGRSYFLNGDPYQNWGALQYDLGLGLLNAWAQTGDAYLFNRAQAAVRNIMDIQVAKFEPYGQKRSGAGVRKGECTTPYHWCQENIPEYNYHSRSLLLYSHLTGEPWPREIAQMLIDNSAYFSLSRRQWTLDHSRILGWALRNLYYGAEEFPNGTKYNDTRESNDYPHMVSGTSYAGLLSDLVSDTVARIEQTGQLPGDQPVWGGQIIEGLIIALESGHLDAALATRTRTAIDTALRHFQANHMRGDSTSGYEIAYALDNSWRDAEAYGWFWVNNFAWASENLDASYQSSFENFYDWLDSRFRSDNSLQSIRLWTGVIGFSAYAAEKRN